MVYHTSRMKLFIRTFLFCAFALWLTSQALPTLRTDGTMATLLFGGLVLSLLMLLVAPLLKILFIPINIMTFGLLSWLVNVAILYLLTIFVPQIAVVPHTFPGVSWAGFVIPPFHASWGIALILSSLFVTAVTNLLHRVSEHS